MSRARAHPNHPVPPIMHQRRDPPALIAGEELHPARGGGFVHGEQGIGCVCVPGAAVEVAFPVAEGAVVLPGDDGVWLEADLGEQGRQGINLSDHVENQHGQLVFV